MAKIIQDRVKEDLMLSGVTIVDPATTYIDPRAEIGRDTVIQPFTAIEGAVKIGAGCRLGPFAHVTAEREISAGETVMGIPARRPEKGKDFLKEGAS